jgi:ankyrin repeat protein
MAAEHPSHDRRLATCVSAMIQPEELKHDNPLKWSAGRGADVWRLFCACADGDLAAVERLIRQDPPLVRSHYMYRTPLYFAVREDRIPVADFLLRSGADPLSLVVGDSLLQICEDRGYGEMSRLLEANYETAQNAWAAGEAAAAAIRDHDIARLRALLDASPDLLHKGDRRSNQPIHWAAMTRQLDFIDELLSRGADVNAQRFDGAHPLQLANGDYYFRGWRDVPGDWTTSPADVIAHLRSRGAYYDICTACYLGDLPRVRELLDANPALANRVADYTTYYLGSGAPLKNAAARGHLEIVRLLLERGADPNLREEGIAPQGHALYAAAAGQHHQCVKLLLEHGAFPNPPVESSADALSRAISNKDQPMIDLLCSYGASRSLELVACGEDVQTAAAMLAANPALADDPEALSAAASSGNDAFVRLLLHYQPDLPRRIRFPPWSVGAKTCELNELLFAHGMDPSQPDWLLCTPLHHFARKGDVEKAEQFIEHGADLHARDEDICSTPLGWAAKYNQRPRVELLLRYGASPNLDDDPRWATPLAWAARRGHQEIAEILKQHGAN